MPLPDAVQYGQVKWRAVSAVADGLDVDGNPDAVPVGGTVTFSPSATVLLALNGAPPVTVFATPVTYTLDSNGILRDGEGRDLITLVATDSAGLTPAGWTWTATYRLNGGVSRGAFSFTLPAGSVVDLTTVAPVSTSNGTPVIQGPRGEAGPPGPSGTLNGPYISLADHGVLPTNSAAANSAAIAAAIAANPGRNLYIPGSATPYHINQPIDLTAGHVGLYGDTGSTVIVQDTDTACFVKIGSARGALQGLSFRHDAEISNTQGNGIETYDCYFWRIQDVYLNNARTLFQTVTGFFFSCSVTNLIITGYYQHGININRVGNTGSVWNNIYVSNRVLDGSNNSRTSQGAPVNLEYLNESAFNELNIEWCNAPGNALSMNGCGALVFNSIHIEQVHLRLWDSQMINGYGNTQTTINGLTVGFCNVAPTGAEAGGRSIVKAGGSAQIHLTGLYCEQNSMTVTQTARIAATDSDAGSRVWVEGGIRPDIFTGAPVGNVRSLGDPMFVTKAGALTTTDLPRSGMVGVDTTNNRLYWNSNGTVRFTAGT